MRWTESKLAEHLAKTGVPGRDVDNVDVSAPPFQPPSVAGRYALGRLPRGTMNKTESAYAAHLELQRHAGEVLWWKFEPMKFRLADATFYTPDFSVLTKDGFFELREVKGGHWEDDARVKIKVAASLYPFRFIAVTRAGDGWKTENFSR